MKSLLVSKTEVVVLRTLNQILLTIFSKKLYILKIFFSMGFSPFTNFPN